LDFADAFGTSLLNIPISEISARSVYKVLAGKGAEEGDLLAKGLGKYVTQSEFINSANCQ